MAERGWGRPEEEGAHPACPWWWAAPPPHPLPESPQLEPPHFPCVSGKCKSGTKVLREDKGGGRGRWPGFSPRHKGLLAGGGEPWAAEHRRRHRASQEAAAVGRGQPGAARFPLSAASLGREALGRSNLSLAVCEALPQPTASCSFCQEKDLLNASPI